MEEITVKPFIYNLYFPMITKSILCILLYMKKLYFTVRIYNCYPCSSPCYYVATFNLSLDSGAALCRASRRLKSRAFNLPIKKNIHAVKHVHSRA